MVLLKGTRRSGSIQKREFAHKQGILGKFSGELAKLSASQVRLLLSQRGQRQKDLGEGAKVIPLCRRPCELLHAHFSVASDATQAKQQSLVEGQAADNVVGSAKRQVRISGVGFHRQQLLGISF